MSCEKACWKSTDEITIQRIPKHEGGGWIAFSNAFGRGNPGDGGTPLEALADLQTVLDLLTHFDLLSAQAKGGKA